MNEIPRKGIRKICINLARPLNTNALTNIPRKVKIGRCFA